MSAVPQQPSVSEASLLHQKLDASFRGDGGTLEYTPLRERSNLGDLDVDASVVLGGCCENRLEMGFIWLRERRDRGSEPLASINGDLGNC